MPDYKPLEGAEGWDWSIGKCGCGASGVPVASNDYYTCCASCLSKAAEALERVTADFKRLQHSD